jgi:hypothetical protein
MQVVAFHFSRQEYLDLLENQTSADAEHTGATSIAARERVTSGVDALLGSQSPNQ